MKQRFGHKEHAFEYVANALANQTSLPQSRNGGSRAAPPKRQEETDSLYDEPERREFSEEDIARLDAERRRMEGASQ